VKTSEEIERKMCVKTKAKDSIWFELTNNEYADSIPIFIVI
jgi:hypothetical protein